MIRNLIKNSLASLLRFEATLVLKKYKPKIIAVTGNVGKTSAKDAIAAALAPFAHVRASSKSYNSDFGVPLTILDRPAGGRDPVAWVAALLEGLLLLVWPAKYPDWLVLEVGTDRPGDLARIRRWLKADVVVLTRLPAVPVHIEFFKNRKEFLIEETTLVRMLSKNGLAILNFDDPDVLAAKENTQAKVITFGFGDGADLRASNQHVLYRDEDGYQVPDGLTFKLDYDGNSLPVRVRGVLGQHQISAVLAALATTVALDKNIIEAATALENFQTPPGRLRLIPGLKHTLILDDTYNSSPAALEEALKTLASLEVVGRKIVVIGDMLELGEHTIPAHQAVGEQLAKMADYLITVGLRSKFTAEAALKAGLDTKHIKTFDDSVAAGKALQTLIKKGDVILIKGSQGVRMEKAVLEIMAEPEKKDDLLVRQTGEWKGR